MCAKNKLNIKSFLCCKQIKWILGNLLKDTNWKIHTQKEKYTPTHTQSHQCMISVHLPPAALINRELTHTQTHSARVSVWGAGHLVSVSSLSFNTKKTKCLIVFPTNRWSKHVQVVMSWGEEMQQVVTREGLEEA